jgi:uncharacterized protein YfiM (DUF2279 family)
MTIMKKLMFTLAIAALLHVPTARAAYVGTFAAGSFYTFEVLAGAGVETAVTFMSVVRGRLQVDDMMTFVGNAAPRQIMISRQAERIILLIDMRGGSSLIRVNGGVPQEVTANPEARVVADVVP